MDHRRKAFVTGGSKRVGRAIVEKLAANGFDIIFTYHNSDAQARELQEKIISAGSDCQIIKIDLESDQAAANILRSLSAITSQLDLLVNNASIYLPDSSSRNFSQRMMQVNCDAPVQIVKNLSPLLKKARGHVVNMLDILADRPMPSYSIYSASKAALKNATISLARQLAPEVNVNGISPGVVDWPEEMPLEQRETYLEKVPLRRAGTPQDVANLVHFLATDGTYITGQNIRLDGGRSIV